MNTSTLKSSADAALSAGAGDVPGVVAVATNREEIIYEGAFGTTLLGSGIAMTPDTVVWIASMTKAITGLAAMQMVEQGKRHRAPACARTTRNRDNPLWRI